jgi:hypothetical protein
MNRLPALAGALLAVTLLAACKSPRPPYETAEGDVSGEWLAESEASPRDEVPGEIRWRMVLNQGHAGKLEGRGDFAGDRGSGAFAVNGIRGQSAVNFELNMEAGGSAKFDGSILDVKMMVGKMDLDGDTISVTFMRP